MTGPRCARRWPGSLLGYAWRHTISSSCSRDCPGVTPESLQKLVAACEDDAAVPTTGPLPGAYHRRVLPVLEERLASGELTLRDALSELAVRVVPLDSAVLVNVNTREDLKRLEALVRRDAPSDL